MTSEMSGDTNRPMAGCDNDRLRSEGVAREAGAVQPAPATVPRSRQRVLAVLRRRKAQSERRRQGVSTPSEPIGRPDTAAGVAGRSTRHLRLGVPTRRARHTRARPNRCGRGLVLRRGSSPRSPQARIRERAPGPWSGTGEASRFKRTSRFPTCQSSANQGPAVASPRGSSDWEPSVFETRASPISLCRKRSFATLPRGITVQRAQIQGARTFSPCSYLEQLAGRSTPPRARSSQKARRGRSRSCKWGIRAHTAETGAARGSATGPVSVPDRAPPGPGCRRAIRLGQGRRRSR